MCRFLNSLLLAGALGACASAGDSTGPETSRPATNNPQPPPPPALPPSEQPASRLSLYLNPNAVYVGMQNWLIIEAADIKGTKVSTDQAGVYTSNPAVASIADSRVFSVSDPSGGVTRQLSVKFALLSVGTTTVSVTLGSVTDSVVLRVLAVEPRSTALSGWPHRGDRLHRTNGVEPQSSCAGHQCWVELLTP